MTTSMHPVTRPMTTRTRKRARVRNIKPTRQASISESRGGLSCAFKVPPGKHDFQTHACSQQELSDPASYAAISADDQNAAGICSRSMQVKSLSHRRPP